MAPPAPPFRRPAAAIFLGALAFHVIGAWGLPLVDRDEPRFAEASREMIERGDYVVPYFNGDFRFDKPPLTYWMQVACYRAFGESELSARLPSAVAASLTAVVVLAFGRRLFGPRPALWAALLFTVGAQTVLHAKGAVADMPMVLAFTVASWSGWELATDRGGGRGGARRWWAALAGSLALGFLAKGPIVWLALPPIVLLARREGRGRGLLAGLAACFLASIAVVALWGVPAIVRTDGRFLAVGLGKHVVGRSVVALEGHGAKSLVTYLLLLPFYFGTVLLTFLPGSVLLPFLVRRLWRRRLPTPANAYLLAILVTVFGVFTFVRTKLPHYVLPAFPALALLVSAHWLDEGRAERVLRRLVVFAAAVWLVVFLVGFPLAARRFPAYRLAREAGTRVTEEMEIGASGFLEPSLVWQLRARTRRTLVELAPGAVGEWLSRPGPRLAVVPTAAARDLVLPAEEGWWSFSVRGFNLPRGRSVDLTLVLRER